MDKLIILLNYTILKKENVTPQIGGENRLVGKDGTTKQNDFCIVFISTNNIQFFKCTLRQFTQSETYRSGSPCSPLIASRISFYLLCLLVTVGFSPSNRSWPGPLSSRAPGPELWLSSAGSH